MNAAAEFGLGKPVQISHIRAAAGCLSNSCAGMGATPRDRVGKATDRVIVGESGIE